MTLSQLPVNGTDRTRVLIRLDGEPKNIAGDSALVDVPVERAQPLRKFYAWPHKRNYEGHWFSTTVGKHVPFESLLERQFLLSADFNPEITAISAQPLGLLWPAGTTVGTANGRTRTLRSHVPDFFCRHTGGEATLVDVRRPDHADDPHFRLTAELCAEVGWHYTVFTGISEPISSNLTWLSGYRTRHYEPSSETSAVICESFAAGISLRGGTQRASRATGLSHPIILGNTLNLLFHGKLRFDPTHLLSMDSRITPAGIPDRTEIQP